MEANYYIGDKCFTATIFYNCPGCGKGDRLSMHVRVISYSQNRRKYSICCMCGWSGPERDSADAAALIWDRRDPGSFITASDIVKEINKK